MADLGNFDASKVEPLVPLEAVPAGTVIAAITASEWKQTKSGNGSYLELVLTITEGEYHKRQLFDRLNLKNPNDTAVKMARATLSAICRAVGVMTPRDSLELHNLPMCVTVACKTLPDGRIGNEVKGYAPKAALAEVAPQTADNTAAPW